MPEVVELATQENDDAALFGSEAETVRASVQLWLAAEQNRYVVPASDETWFAVDLRCTMRNDGDSDVLLCSTDAYKIFPQPYVLNVNGREARLWSGSWMCAPSFTEQNKVRLSPGQEYHGKLGWTVFVENYTRAAGVYRFSARYSFDPAATITMGVSAADLSRLESLWSNEVVIELVPAATPPK